MPEHVHLLISEPERSQLSVVIQMLKQITSHELKAAATPRFWQIRYYDFLVWSEKKRIEKLRYIHRNPVKRGLVARPEDWRWSSFVHYATGTEGIVEIESQWTARQRERMGIYPAVMRTTLSHRTRQEPALSDRASRGSRMGWGNPDLSNSRTKGWASPQRFKG
jgi:hypothetical protein